MDTKRFGQHISHQFDNELEDIRNKVLTMGGVVEEQIVQAVKAFTRVDIELAETVIQQDDVVNSLEMDIDHECTEILAKRQPAAFDLRLLLATIKIITDLERIGDEACRIAKMSIQLANSEYYHEGFHEIQHLVDMVKKMLHQSLDAFARMDLSQVAEIKSQDVRADREYVSIVRQLITRMMEDPRHISRALDILWIARALERIGDHSCNISEQAIYMVKGKDVRHTTQEEFEQALVEKR